VQATPLLVPPSLVAIPASVCIATAAKPAREFIAMLEHPETTTAKVRALRMDFHFSLLVEKLIGFGTAW